ncbi:hypothetical protein [Streptomyces sp. NPDC046821]|uniref:hypothetical protein n=1 Tax=Streptomyces sp. NPDC046821 TaxID=3154702 RepID=UPI003403A59C
MMFHGHDTAPASQGRLLPWASLDGNPCYLVSDGTGTSYVSRVADGVESVQLEMADDLLSHASDLLADAHGKATAPQLHFLAARLAESLRDVRRIALSRGGRLPSSDRGDAD